MLLALIKVSILAVVLVVVELKRHDILIVKEHGVFNLSIGVRQISLGPLFVGLQLGGKIDAFIRVVWDIISWVDEHHRDVRIRLVSLCI